MARPKKEEVVPEVTASVAPSVVFPEISNDVELPEFNEEWSDARKELHGVYTRFIKQSPQKWEVEKGHLMDKFNKLA